MMHAAAMPEPPACRPGQPCRMQGLRTLLVDDNPARTGQRVVGLLRHGMEVRVAASPAEAVAIIRGGWMADAAVVELGGDPAIGAGVLNTLRDYRGWMPAVLIGPAAAVDALDARDQSVRTVWRARVDSAVLLTAALLNACCHGRRPGACPFRVLAGLAPRTPMTVVEGGRAAA